MLARLRSHPNIAAAGTWVLVAALLLPLAPSGGASHQSTSRPRHPSADPALAYTLRQALSPLAAASAPAFASLTSSARIERAARRLARLERTAAARIPDPAVWPSERHATAALGAVLRSQAAALTNAARSARPERRRAYAHAAAALEHDSRRLLAAVLNLRSLGFAALPLPPTLSLPPLPPPATLAVEPEPSSGATGPSYSTPSYTPPPSPSGSGEAETVPHLNTEPVEPLETPKPSK